MLKIEGVQDDRKERFELITASATNLQKPASGHRKRVRRYAKKSPFEDRKAAVDEHSGTKSSDKTYRVREVRMRRLVVEMQKIAGLYGDFAKQFVSSLEPSYRVYGSRQHRSQRVSGNFEKPGRLARPFPGPYRLQSIHQPLVDKISPSAYGGRDRRGSHALSNRPGLINVFGGRHPENRVCRKTSGHHLHACDKQMLDPYSCY